MSRTNMVLFVTILTATAGAEPPARVDRHDDPLPAEAIARMGSLRLRQGATVHSLAFTPNGATLIAHGWGDNGLCVWDAITGKEVRRFAQDRDKPPASSCLSPDGKTVASVSGIFGEGITLWDVPAGRQVRQFGSRRYRSACFSPDGKMLAGLAVDGTVELWDAASAALVRSWEAHRGGAWYGAFGPEGKALITAGADRTVRAWEAATAIQTFQLDVNPHPDVPLALSRDGKLLAVVAQAEPAKTPPAPDHRIRLYDPASGKEVRQLAIPAKNRRTGEPTGVTSLAFSADGKILAAGGNDRTLRLWAPPAGTELRQFTDYFAATVPLAVSPDGKTLATADGGTLRLRDSATGKDRLPLFGHTTWIFTAAHAADGKTLATAGQGGVIYLWEPATGRELRSFAGHDNNVLSLVMSADGRTLYSTGLDRTVRAWETASGREVYRTKGTEATRLDSLALSPDGKTLAVPGPDRSVLLLNASDGKQQGQLKGLDLVVNGVAFAAGGSLLTWTRDQNVAVWDVAADTKLRQFATGEARQRPLPAGGTGYVGYAAAASADGRLVALGLKEGTVFVLDTATGQEVRRLTGLPGGVSALAFSPDGRTLAVGGWDDPTVRLMELGTGREAHVFTGHRGRVVCLTFAADGRTLVSGSGDTTALVWDLTGRLDAKVRWGKLLTPDERDACWQALRGEDATAAWNAVRRLAADAANSVPYLQKKLLPIPVAEQGKLAKLIAELDSDRFEVRKQAAAELEKLGDSAVGACRRALEGRPSPEARRQLEELLEKETRQKWSPSPQRLGSLRALEALERAGTAEARRLLEGLARGAPGAWLTEEAQGALRRLDRRPGAASP
jgi:WD40 repeat protein